MFEVATITFLQSISVSHQTPQCVPLKSVRSILACSSERCLRASNSSNIEADSGVPIKFWLIKDWQMGGKEGSQCLWGIKLRNEEVGAGECCHKRINYQSRFLVEKVMYQLPRLSTQNFTEDFTTDKFSCSRIPACVTDSERRVKLKTLLQRWHYLKDCHTDSISILGLDMDIVHMSITLCEMMALFCRERTYGLYTNNGKMKNIYKYSCKGSTPSKTVPVQ